jgi:excisionase family DNA binding protein
LNPEPQAEWLDLKALRVYASASDRTIRTWIHRQRDPLPASQAGGKIRVRRSAFDAWMDRQTIKKVDVNSIVNDIVMALK